MNVLHPIYSKCTILHCQCMHEAIHIACDSSYPSTLCHTHDSGNSAGRHCRQGGIACREALPAGRHCLQGGIACREALPAGRHCLQLRWLHPTNWCTHTGLSQTGGARSSWSPRSRGSLPKGGLPSSVLYKIGKKHKSSRRSEAQLHLRCLTGTSIVYRIVFIWGLLSVREVVVSKSCI